MSFRVNPLPLLLVALAGGVAAGASSGEYAPAQPGAPAAAQYPDVLAGHCVVTLRDRQQWQPGDAATGAIFDGRRYQFAGARERAIFAASPADYAPVLGGDCLVTFAETGARIPGRLEHGALHGHRLLFFADGAARDRFLSDRARYADADVACGGRCPVARVDEGKEVPGIAETAVVYQGLRYLFSSSYHRTLFLANPARYDGSGGDDESSQQGRELASGRDDLHGKSSPWSPPAPTEKPPKDASDRSKPDTALSALPAMGGFCPVTLNQEGIWVRGRYEHRVELGDLIFLTASAAKQAALKADPAAYVPACGGDCPVTLVTRDERVRGSVFHAAEYDGRLFLLADAERKAEFAADPARFAVADLAAEGLCVVTREDEGRQVRGAPEFAAWHEGRLYRFASPEQKDRFLKNPARYATPSTSGR